MEMQGKPNQVDHRHGERKTLRTAVDSCSGSGAPTAPRSTVLKEAYLMTTRTFAFQNQQNLESEEVRRSLVAQVQAGDSDATQKLIEMSLPLLQRLARLNSRSDMPAEELVSEGAIVLIQAARNYRLDSPVPFAAYAATWLRHGMRHATHRLSRTIRVPSRAQGRINRIATAGRLIEAETGQRATPREIAAATGIPEWEVVANLERRRCPLSLEHAGTSIDVADPRSAGRRNASDGEPEMPVSKIDSMLESIPDSDRAMVRRRFGLGGRRAATLRDLAREFGMSRSQAQLAIERALRRLRQNAAA
jgi:RNA polymerase sigma factor (sigma-70 family)